MSGPNLAKGGGKLHRSRRDLVIESSTDQPKRFLEGRPATNKGEFHYVKFTQNPTFNARPWVSILGSHLPALPSELDDQYWTDNQLTGCSYWITEPRTQRSGKVV